jgi:hypothetical protein
MHLPLNRPQAQSDPLLSLELLPNHIGVAGMPAETLRHVAHAEFAADLLHVGRLALVGEARIMGDSVTPTIS